MIKLNRVIKFNKELIKYLIAVHIARKIGGLADRHTY